MVRGCGCHGGSGGGPGLVGGGVGRELGDDRAGAGLNLVGEGDGLLVRLPPQSLAGRWWGGCSPG